MIRLYFDYILTSFQVVTLVFEAFYNSYKLFIRSRVIDLSSLKLLREEG